MPSLGHTSLLRPRPGGCRRWPRVCCIPATALAGARGPIAPPPQQVHTEKTKRIIRGAAMKEL